MVSIAERPVRSDRVRQVAVTVSEIACLVGTLVGIGMLGGTSVADSAGGVLDSDATLIAPAGPAFSIWSVIYLGLAAYTVWQWLPARAVAPRHRAIGWWAAASMLLNAGWLLVTRAGWLWPSVVVIVALVAVLARILVLLSRDPGPGGERAGRLAELIVVDGTFGAYLGWVCAATCANVTAALVSSGVRPAARTAEIVAALVLAVAAAVGVLVAIRLGGRYAVAIAFAWGLAWIGFGRVGEGPRSVLTAVVAWVAAVVVVVAAIRWHRRSRSTAS